MPATMSWEGLLLLLRRQLSSLFRCEIIDEFAVAYETLLVYFEIDGQQHEIPVCHCWCSVNPNTNMIDASSYVYDRLHSLGLMLIDDHFEVSDDYIEGMRNLMIHWEDFPLVNKYIRWRVVNNNNELKLIRVEFGQDLHSLTSSKT